MSITYSPTFKMLRAVSANDAALPADRREGFNLADFDEVLVQATLHGSATAATVQAYFWSDEAGAFLPESTAVTFSVAGSGVLCRARVHRHGSVFFRVTSITGGTPGAVWVKLAFAGVPAYHQVG